MNEVIKRLPTTYQKAAQVLTDWNAIKTLDYLQKVVKTPRNTSHPQIVEFYLHFNRALKARGYPFFAFEFERSPARSDILFKQGVSKARGGQSPHNYGCAVDIVHTRKFWDLNKWEWEIIGAIGKEVARKRKIKIVWGGDFKSIYDPAHWELAHWRDLRLALHELHIQGEVPAEKDESYYRLLETRASKFK